jgi:LuxR family maltose regulon positive regulatory protein
MISGDLEVASTLNKQLGQAGIDNDAVSFYSWSLYNQGLIHFQRNELDEAIHHLSQAADYGYLMLRRATVDCMAGLALAYQAAQRPDKAATALDNLLEYIHSLNEPALLDIAHSCRARLLLMEKKASTAPIVPIINPTSNDGAMAIWFEIPCVTRCRALIAEGSDIGLRESEQRLRGYAEMNEAHHNTYQLIGILSLLSIACEKQEKFDEAQTSLEQALTLARPGNFIFPFLEIGTPMEDLLNRLHNQKMTDNYIEKLLAEFRADVLGSMPNASTSDLIPSPSKVPQPLVEPLTNRELDVLELLAQRLQNKEIAEKLYVSNQTVKSHLKNIYQKLNVSNRRQAVAQAYQLGIIARR